MVKTFLKVRLSVGLILFLMAGCSTMFTNPRAVSIEDVIYLSRHQLGADVIMKHIETTHSRFELTTEDIVRLKDGGVDEEVIEFMVERSTPEPPFAYEYRLPPYLRYPFVGGPTIVSEYYYPLYESYTGYYPYPYSLYTSPFLRRSGLIGRFYEYPALPFGTNEDRSRRSDDDRNVEEGERSE